MCFWLPTGVSNPFRVRDSHGAFVPGVITPGYGEFWPLAKFSGAPDTWFSVVLRGFVPLCDD